MLPGEVVCSAEALVVLANRAEIGRLHMSLRPIPVWRDDAEMAQVYQQVSAELSGLPVYERPGVLDRDFEVSLRCICRPEVAFLALTHIRGELRTVLACSLGREGILAISERGRVVLRQADPMRLPETLVGALPNHHPAVFKPFSVPIREEEPANGPMHGAPAPPRSRERELWDELVAREQFGGGQITLELRDAMGRSRKSDEPFTFVDADLGRWYRATERRGEHGYVFCAPLPAPEFPVRLRGMHEQLTA